VQETVRTDFARLLADGRAVDLGRGALTIARVGHPTLDVEAELARLDVLAEAIEPAVPRTRPAADRARRVVRELDRLGFRGNQDDYYDPRNSFLNDVIERRLGIPITLSLLAIEVGRRLDVPLAGVTFPGHFILRAATEDAPLFLDPFHGGVEVDDDTLLVRLRQLSKQLGREETDFETVPPEFLQPAPARAILARMLRNLVAAYQQRAEDERALAAVDLLLVATPDAPHELRTRALLYERLKCPASAVADFRRYLELEPAAPDAAAIEMRAAKLADEAPTLH
jgi:regulator of sirC expression with transglutaminase-like and TPR domain